MTVVVPPIPTQIVPFTLLGMIYAKIRRLTGSGTSLQITDTRVAGINPTPQNVVCLSDYVNSFYNYDLPAEFRSLILKDKLTFNTIQGIDTYPFDSEHYTTVEMPVYCAKREIALFQDPWSFYGVNFNWQFQTNFASGNGVTGTGYTGFTQSAPLLRSTNNTPGTAVSPNLNYPAFRVQNILITANTATSTLNVTDDGQGNLFQLLDTGYAKNVGTINYQTGAISITDFINPTTTAAIAIPAGNIIQIQYNPQLLNQPLSIMFFQNQFTLRPVPDKGYTIEMVAYRQPVQALASTPATSGTAELNEWWELIAVGAAKKLFEDRLDFDGVQLMDKMLQERYSVAQTRTYAQLGKQRLRTIFADQLSNNYGTGPGGFGGTGSV